MVTTSHGCEWRWVRICVRAGDGRVATPRRRLVGPRHGGVDRHDDHRDDRYGLGRPRLATATTRRPTRGGPSKVWTRGAAGGGHPRPRRGGGHGGHPARRFGHPRHAVGRPRQRDRRVGRSAGELAGRCETNTELQVCMLTTQDAVLVGGEVLYSNAGGSWAFDLEAQTWRATPRYSGVAAGDLLFAWAARRRPRLPGSDAGVTLATTSPPCADWTRVAPNAGLGAHRAWYRGCAAHPCSPCCRSRRRCWPPAADLTARSTAGWSRRLTAGGHRSPSTAAT